jgi:hypothetical protein
MAAAVPAGCNLQTIGSPDLQFANFGSRHFRRMGLVERGNPDFAQFYFFCAVGTVLARRKASPDTDARG